MKKALLKLMFLFAVLCLFNIDSYGQLKKTGTVEKVKLFHNGSVPLCKSILNDPSIEIYSVVLSNWSSLYDDIVLCLGTKDELIKNLSDLSLALKDGEKGDVYEFSAWGQDYHLSYHKVLGDVCFKVRHTYSTNDDYGNFYKTTIDDILEYIQNNNNPSK